MECKDFEPSIIQDKDKILKLCRRLKKCTLDDLVSLTETNEDIVKTALLYLENEGFIQLLPDNNGLDGFFIARLIKC